MLGGKQERDVSEITEASILKRAKENSERDGVAWRAEMTTRSGKKFMPLARSLNEKGRHEYLDKAKEQLLKERGEQQ
jgi:hypothetical protein